MILASAFRVLVNRFSLITALLGVIFQTALVGASNLPSAADGFDPNVAGNVYALAQQTDGKVIVGGLFTLLQANGGAQEGHVNLARIGIGGLADTTFAPDTNGQVNAVVIQANGKILVGGEFTTIGGVARNRIARLNTDGSVDSSFNPNANGSVNAIALAANGDILLGGAFTTIGASTRNRIARVSSTTGLADAFDPNANLLVDAIAIQGDGRIVIGGGFTTLQPNGASTPTIRNRAARLNSDGSIDALFDPNLNNLVTSVAVQVDGKIILAGNFITVQPNGTDSITSRNHIVRFGSDGLLDSFDPNIDKNVSTVVLQPDGKILVGGIFSSLRPSGTSVVGRNFLARLNVDGTVDTSFNAGPNNQVSAIVVQADGSVILGGYFTQLIAGATNAIITTRNRLARVNSQGLLDITFDPNARGAVLAQAVDSGGNAIVGGTFSSVGNVTRNFLARIGKTGALDTSFNPSPNGAVTAVALQSDGNILVGGSFTTIGGVTRNRIARLNSAGVVDTTFDPNFDAPVNTIVLQSDGKILVGGSFTTATPNGAATAISHFYLVRLNANGTLDEAFYPLPNSPVSAIVVQSDGKIVIGGSFSALQPNSATFQTPRNFLARLNSDGSVDNDYNPNPNSLVSALALQSDGQVVAGGSFAAFVPASDLTATLRSRVARITKDGKLDANFNPNINSSVGLINSIVVQPDQRIIVGGVFNSIQPNTDVSFTVRNYLVRLNTDGNVDTTFDPNPNGAVRSITVLSDSTLLVGGAFSSFQPNGAATGTNRFHLARLAANGTVDPSFDPSVGGQAGGSVNAIAVQANGRFILAGSFGETGGGTGGNITRFNADSTADAGFAPAADGPINALAVRPNSEPVATQTSGLAYLNADGSLNSAFAPRSNLRLTGQVYAVTKDLDGNILVGGSFLNTTGATGRNLLRLFPDGQLDPNFNPDPDGAVHSIVVQADRKILVGGAFSNIAGSLRLHIARLNGDGSADAFDPAASSTVFSIVIQDDLKIILAGSFTSFMPNSATSSTTRDFIARVNVDGTVDTNYNPNASAEIFSMAKQGDKVVVGGSFTTFTPNSATTATTRNYIARINNDGTVDSTFDPNSNNSVLAVAVQSDGSVLMGGNFTSIGGWDTPYLNRTSSTGANDGNFGHRPNGPVDSITLQTTSGTPGQRILIGGTFTTVDGVSRNRLARINADNSLDTAFNPNADGQINIIFPNSDGSLIVGGAFTTVQPLGAIYVGGSFTNIGSAAVSNLALINDDGSASSNFRPTPNAPVYALAIQSDSRALVAGDFTSIYGAARNRIARINADGTLDTAFNPNADNRVDALAIQSDGKIVLGGSFTSVGGASRSRLARISATGAVDSFNPGADGQVYAIAAQADGKLIVGGAFTNVGGAGRSRLARLNSDGSADTTFNANVTGSIVNAVLVQADGKILVGGTFSAIAGSARSNVARLNSDGSLDATFDPSADGAVLAMSLSTDGKLLVGGAFSQIGGLNRSRFARLASTSLALQTLSTTNNMTSVLWTRDGSAPEISGVIFEQSSDAITWTALGLGSRSTVPGSWVLNGVSLPTASVFYLRARGIVPSSQYSSSGLTETIRLLTPVPVTTSATTVGGTVGSAFYYAITSASGANSFAASGLPAGLTIDRTTGIISGTPIASGSFVVTISATNVGGSSTTTLTISVSAAGGAVPSGSRLISLAARARVSGDNPLIAGFVIGGSEAKSILLRGIGPTLNTTFQVQGALATPQLRLYNSSGQLILTAGSWSSQPSLAAVFSSVGAFALPAGSADAATVATLQPGVYTVQVVDPRGVGGVALAEIYDVTPSAAPKLVEISARGSVDTGEGILIGGLVISGTSSKKVLLRGAGPTLGNLGVSGVLADPVLTLYNTQAQALASNDNWEAPVTVNASYPASSAATIAAAAASSGAFPFPSGAKDAAMIVTLAPGNYTVQVAGVSSTTGIALVEIYELP